MALLERVAALMGRSAHRLPAGTVVGPSDQMVNDVRDRHGGQLSPRPISQVRFYQKHVEWAEVAADGGSMEQAARLMRAARKDGVYAGVLSTRTGGLVRLPKRFRGRDDIVSELQLGADKTRSVFDEMFPATELALLAADGLELGVGIAELVPVVGRNYPVMVRLDPEFLIYRWSENQWYYRSIAGLIPITPGDGQWILHMPGGRVSPWQHGIWRAIGKSFIRKEHANLYKDNWEAKLANSARVATVPAGSSEEQKQGWFSRVAAWAINSVFMMPPGYDVRLVESNGRGYQSFSDTVERENNEMIIAVAGQTVTTEGGAGFQNSDVHKSIRADLIKETADGLAYTINTQGLPSFIIDNYGEDALEEGAVVEWDVTPPKDRTSEAAAMVSTAQAMSQLTESLATHGVQLDVNSFVKIFGIPVVEESDKKNITKLIEIPPSDKSKVLRVSEAREFMGLPELGDNRDDKTVSELGSETDADAKASADAAADIAVSKATETSEPAVNGVAV